MNVAILWNEETDQGSFLKKDTWAQGFAHRRHTLKLFTWLRDWLANEPGGIFPDRRWRKRRVMFRERWLSWSIQRTTEALKRWPDSLLGLQIERMTWSEGENGSFVTGAEMQKRIWIKRYLGTDFKYSRAWLGDYEMSQKGG